MLYFQPIKRQPGKTSTVHWAKTSKLVSSCNVTSGSVAEQSKVLRSKLWNNRPSKMGKKGEEDTGGGKKEKEGKKERKEEMSLKVLKHPFAAVVII